ncbi:MAG: hypothetical protein QOG52_2693 [Frankiaceae bacterium]|nr:hypothetical protein [Frankiaceae bacterium]
MQLNDTQVARLVERYRVGATVYQLAAEFGIDRKTVARRLKTAGVSLRLASPTTADVDEMVRLYDTGLALADVGERLGVGARTVQRHLRQRGVSTRDTHGRVRS